MKFLKVFLLLSIIFSSFQFSIEKKKNLKLKPTVENRKREDPASSTTSATADATKGPSDLTKPVGNDLIHSLPGTSTDTEMQKIWEKIFNNANKSPTCNTGTPVYLEKQKEESIYIESKVPTPKPNIPKSLKYGFGDAAYFFDYIDLCFKDEVVKEFKAMFDAVKAFPYNESLDPYSPSKLLEMLNSQGYGANIPQNLFGQDAANLKDAILDVIEQITKKRISKSTYLAGISMDQLDQVFGTFHWDMPKYTKHANISYYLFNKYDYNGDGRLGPSEFILFAIQYNKAYIGNTSSKKYIFSNFVEKRLTPMFYFGDCDNDGFISAENIWFMSEKLTCAAGKGYNIFRCDAKADNSNTDYRTASVNDLVLKNMKTADGKLSPEEWYQAILLGFWDRQTNDQKIVDDSTLSHTDLRWSDQGATDIGCEEIKKYQEKTQ